ncbi:MAG: DUF1028 domain-containing protein, partial [Actinomycetota bacterium]
ASKFLAAGALVPWAQVGAGTIATQAHADVSFGPHGLSLLADGRSADEVVEVLIGSSPLRDKCQIGVIDSHGNAASFTGPECMAWAGGTIGESYAVQGNILAGPEVVAATAEAFEREAGDLAGRLVAAILGGTAAGGDRRGRQSAAVLVMSPRGGYGGTTDVVVDLRVDDHPDPARELSRLLDLHRLYFTKPTEADLVPVDAALSSEMAGSLRTLGFLEGPDDDLWKALERFAGWENLEERFAMGDRLDRHILAALRSAAALGERMVFPT